jgi:futalosine hydrolase
LNITNKQQGSVNCLVDEHNFKVYHLNTGIGMLQTCLHLTKTLENSKFDLLINAGVAGSVRGASIGQTYNVTHDHVYDFGAEDHQNFIPMQSLGLLSEADTPLHQRFIELHAAKFRSLINLPKAHGITVNKVHGNENSIDKIKDFIDKENIQGPMLESMEGAAFAYVASIYKTSCLQIRAVSNLVEPRNRENWKMKEAINSLNENLQFILQDLKADMD